MEPPIPAGRRPNPTHLKLQRGNPGKRAINHDEPQPAKGLPPCPDFLSLKAKEAWPEIGGELDGMGVLTLSDRTALVLLCEAYADWFECVELIRDEGLVYETETENGSRVKRPHPAVAMRNDAHKRIQSLLIEFGLTPASRSKVKKVEGGAVDPLEALRRKKQQA